MMDDVTQFIENYKGKSGEEILASPAIERDVNRLKNALRGCDPDQRQEAEAILKTLDDALDPHIADLKAQMEKGLDTIQRVQKNSEACIAYLEAGKEK